MNWAKYVAAALAVMIVVFIGFKLGSRSRNDEVADLATQIAKNEHTSEIQKNLYATTVVELNSVENLLDGSRTEVMLLKDQLKKSGAELLTSQQLSLAWKKAYEKQLAANQTEEPPVHDGDPPRKRIDFDGNLGPIHAVGHTITDPPEAHLKLEQLVPLILTVAVAQNKDGSWSSFVTSSDDNIDVKVNLAGVSTNIFTQKWYQRIWIDTGVTALGDPVGLLGLSYRGDRYSVGAVCAASAGSMNGCGATLGFRIFK